MAQNAAFNAQQAAELQDSGEALDKAKSVGGAVKEGYGIAKELTGELKEAKGWHDMMEKATENAWGKPSSGLEEENWYYGAVAAYAQQEAIYHGLRAGLTLLDATDGAYKQPVSGVVKFIHGLATYGAQQLALRNAATAKEQMNRAHDVFVQRLYAVYGPPEIVNP
jgi:hypothetical protein